MPEPDPTAPYVPSDLTHPTDDLTPPGISRRQALAMGGGLAAAAAVIGAGPASAQTASPTADPSPTVDPSVSPSPTTPATPTGIAGAPQQVASISLAQAQAVLDGALAAARAPGVPPMHVVVVDACGDVKASARQDGNGPAALTLAPLKAQTALAFRQPSDFFAANPDPVRVQALLSAGFTALGGGLPIRSGETVIGAVGVGGGSPEQDVAVAEAGIDAARAAAPAPSTPSS